MSIKYSRIIVIILTEIGFLLKEELTTERESLRENNTAETESRKIVLHFARIIILSICARVSHHTAIWRVHYLFAKLAHSR